MEDQRLLDVPITEAERRRSDSDQGTLLDANDPRRFARNRESSATIERFRSLRTSAYRADNSEYVTKSHIAHQRIPSDFDYEPQQVVNFNQPTNYDRQTVYPRVEYPPELWKPFWIRKTTIGVLFLLFLAVMIGTILLWHYSRQLDGFNLQSSTSYYAWTYAPVAFMIIILSIWRQVDYYFKLLAPWNELRKGPVSATDSLLVDYVSPIHLVSLFAAFKRGCIPVILSILVFVSLKVITIFSAALLIPLSTVTTINSTFATTAKSFDASSLNLSTTSNISFFTSDPVYTAIGNIAYNLPYKPGVTSQYAYLPASLSPSTVYNLATTTYTTQTDVLFPNLSCEPFNVVLAGNSTTQANRTTVNMTSNSIHLRLPNGNVCDSWVNPTVYALNPQKDKSPSRQLEGTMQRVYCAEDQEQGTQPSEPAGLLFTVTDIRYSQYISPNGSIANSSRKISAMTNILCIPGYYIINAEINNNSAIYGNSANEIQMLDVQNRTLDGLSGRDLAVIYERTMNASSGIFGTRQENSQALSIPNTVFNLMGLMMNETGLEPFLNSDFMQTAAEKAFRQVLSNYAEQRLTKPSQTNMTAQAVYTQQKLHVNSVPFYIILVLSALSALFTALLFIITPGPLVPKDPSLIATSAAILARSPEFNRVLRKQISSKTAMAVAMSEFQFGSAIATNEHGQSSFKIVVTDAPSKPVLPIEMRSGQWWSPNMLLLPVLLVAIIVPLILIGILEYLQSRSDSDQGLMNLMLGPSTAIYIHCIPVLAMLLISAAVEILNFQVVLFSPWNKLRGGNATANSSLFSHLLGELPPVAYVKAILGGHIGAIASISAAVLAGAVVIVSAGLYSVQNFTVVGFPQTLAASSALTVQNNYNVFDDRGAAGLLRLIDEQNSTYPADTFENLVFPSYSYAADDVPVSPLNATVGPSMATIPALRPNLQCDIVPDMDTDVLHIPADRLWKFDRYIIDSKYNLTDSCREAIAGTNGTSSSFYFRNHFTMNKSESVLFGGQLLDLVFGQNASLENYYGEARAATTGNSPAVGCPSLAFSFVEIHRDNVQVPQVSSFVCYQQIQQLEANITFNTNSTEFDPNHSPQAIESSISLMTNPNSTNGAKSFDWRIQLNIERQLFGLNSARLESGNSSTTFQFDSFFSYLINSTSEKDPSPFTGISNQGSLMSAINSLYSRYMAQVINGNMRGPVTSTSNRMQKRQSSSISPVNAQGNTIQPALIQDRTSKLILQVLFGLVAMFCIIAYALTNFHRLLPCNPCSIAGTMTLLAGSDLCWSREDTLCDCCGKPRRGSWTHDHTDNSEESINADPNEYHTTATKPCRTLYIPVGAEWATPTRFAAFFAGHRYSLGWWREDRSKGRRRRFGIDVGATPDGEHDDDWELGDRRPLGNNNGFEGLVGKGRAMLGDSRGRYQPASDGLPRTSVRPVRTPTPELQQEYREHDPPGHEAYVYAHGGLNDPECEHEHVHVREYDDSDDRGRAQTPELQQEYRERGLGYGQEYGYGHGYGHGYEDVQEPQHTHAHAPGHSHDPEYEPVYEEQDIASPPLPPMSPLRSRFHRM